jgi:hypothetical protein
MVFFVLARWALNSQNLRFFDPVGQVKSEPAPKPIGRVSAKSENGASPHVKYMSYYGFDPPAMKGWVSLGLAQIGDGNCQVGKLQHERRAQRVEHAEKYQIPYHYGNFNCIFARGVGLAPGSGRGPWRRWSRRIQAQHGGGQGTALHLPRRRDLLHERDLSASAPAGGSARLAFSTVNQFCVAVFHGRAAALSWGVGTCHY